MPMTYRIDSDAGRLEVVGDGAITQPERLEAMHAWRRHPAYRPGLRTLCDFSTATSTPTLAELHEIVALIEQEAASVGKRKVAMVTAAPVTYGVARQFQALTADTESLLVQVFTDRSAALEWLDREGL
jgi:hypothetical protein